MKVCLVYWLCQLEMELATQVLDKVVSLHAKSLGSGITLSVLFHLQLWINSGTDWIL